MMASIMMAIQIWEKKAKSKLGVRRTEEFWNEVEMKKLGNS